MSGLITIRMRWIRPEMLDQDIFVVSGAPQEGQDLYDLWNEGIEDALAFGADWMFFQEPGVNLNPTAFTAVAPALTSYDAVWGAMDLGDDVGGQSVPKLTTFTCDDLLGACHLALVWWVGRSHFVRTKVASVLRFSADQGGFADYFLRNWQNNRCLKTAQAFVSGGRQLPEWNTEERRFITNFLETDPQFITFDYAGQDIKLPYTGKNPTLERTQLRGVFFEQRDLEALIDIVKPGAVIVDVGANTGNHTVFFAHVLKAAKIIPIEPNPQTVGYLKSTISANGLEVVDTSKLGVGVGETRSTLFLHTGRRGHLGTVRLDSEGDTAVDVWPLDDLIDEPVDFLKIDVEDMEVEVLKGARMLFTRDRPSALVEVQDDNIAAFLAILEELGYRIDRIFADHGYANYLIAPEEGR